MMSFPALSKMQLRLVALSAILAAVFIYELYAPLRDVSLPLGEAKHVLQGAAPVADFVPPAATLFTDIDTRPPFSPSRRPRPIEKPKPQVQVEATPPPVANVMLFGIVAGPEGRLAVVKTQGGDTARMLHIGETIDGWTLAAIGVDGILLEAGGHQQELKLSKAPDARMTVAPSAASAASATEAMSTQGTTSAPAAAADSLSPPKQSPVNTPPDLARLRQLFEERKSHTPPQSQP